MALGKEKLDSGEVKLKTTETMAKVADSYTGFKKKETKNDMKLFTFHMDPEDRETLRHHLKSKRGLGWAQGVRAVLYEYMRKEKLI